MSHPVSEAGGKRVAGIVQPTYLPWLPFFERMACSDVFVYLDDVQYSKNSFHNRNAIKGRHGPILLTVPVLHSGYGGALINEVKIDNRSAWGRKHWRTIQANYARAPFFFAYAAELEGLFAAPAERLMDIVLPLIEFLRRELGVDTPCHMASTLRAGGSRNQKLVNLCKALDATHLIVKPGTEDYHPPQEFTPHGIAFEHIQYRHLRYRQLHGEFVPGLSALDFVLNNGPGRFVQMLGATAVPTL